MNVRDHKKIAIRYFKSYWMALDFMATFPFTWFFSDDFVITKLLRLFRLTKLMSLFDVSRIKRLVKSVFEKSTKPDRFQS